MPPSLQDVHTDCIHSIVPTVLSHGNTVATTVSEQGQITAPNEQNVLESYQCTEDLST